MPNLPSTSAPIRKLNQQEIIAEKARVAGRGEDQRLAQAHDLGQRLRAELGGWTLPLLAVQSTYSLLRGTTSIEVWGAALGALRADGAGPARDRRGGNYPSSGLPG